MSPPGARLTVRGVLVYGDRSTAVDPREALGLLREHAVRLGGAPPGLRRHAQVVDLLLEAGELSQGLLDADFEEAGRDRWTPIAAATADLLRAIGREVCASVEARFASRGTLHLPLASMSRLAALALPCTVHVRQPEGPSFYALYPELYVLAAAGSNLRGALAVGIRSVGTSLAGVVAAALDGPPPLTVRPIGDVHARSLALDAAFEARLRSARGWAVVDEGPGLSGSSFAAVARALGVDGNVELFPSHRGGPGPMADPVIRKLWERLPQRVCEFEEVFLGGSRVPALPSWAEDLIGPPVAPVVDLSAGAWRSRRGGGHFPADVRHERRKYLVRTGSGDWLLKFAGLGEAGRDAFRRAQRLTDAGWTPRVAGLRHGFLVQRWESDATPLPLSAALPRDRLVRHIADYVAFRATALPGGTGASLRTLFDMAKRNVALALGVDAAERLDAWEPLLCPLERAVRRCAVDARMHAWEWLVTPARRLIKTDAIDHCRGHDLVGCQDPAWDLAGAAVELSLDGAEREELLRRFAVHAPPPPRELVEFLRIAYLAFQLGRSALGAAAVADWAPTDAALLEEERRRYAQLLRAELSSIAAAGRSDGSSPLADGDVTPRTPLPGPCS